MKYGYLPLIEGKPARFDGDQLCFVDHKAGRFIAELVATRTRVLSQIKRSQEFRRAALGETTVDFKYSWVRVAMPVATAKRAARRKGER